MCDFNKISTLDLRQYLLQIERKTAIEINYKRG